MQKNTILMSVVVIIFTLFAGYNCTKPLKSRFTMKYQISSAQEIPNLFPKNINSVENLVKQAKIDIQQAIDEIINTANENLTFDNTFKSFDTAVGIHASTAFGYLQVIAYLNQDSTMREAAQKGMVELSALLTDLLHNNDLYEKLKYYADNHAQNETLNDEQNYFLHETMTDFKNNGLNLPKETQARIKEIEKKLSELSIQYNQNINTDQSTVTTTKDDLAGMSNNFIESLDKNENGDYILTTDYPVFFPITENCTIESTRKKIFHAYTNRAHPKNSVIMDEMIALRDQKAKLLNFKSFSDYHLNDQMAKNPETVETFLESLIKKAKIKYEKEFALFSKNLPDGVTLTNDNKIKEWDAKFVVNSYKKKNYNIDDQAVAEYFPLENTLKGLLKIYEQFFDIILKSEPLENVWNDEVQLISAYSKNNECIGYIILDLYPRQNKYGHACAIAIINPLKKDGKATPALSCVIANFPKPTNDRPSLLPLNDVRTFFHEFGHAIHSLFGATQMASFAGYNVKHDFVEMPSQMLEEWLWDKDIIKNLSNHYQTGEQLPDETIDKIIALKNINIGWWILRQASFSLASLRYFGPGEQKDTKAMMNEIFSSTIHKQALYEHHNTQSSFGHLSGYGARYYCYLWSKIFALDLFDTIKSKGLTNSEIGTQYKKEILRKGGSLDPNTMLKNFLGRSPNSDAFFSYHGL